MRTQASAAPGTVVGEAVEVLHVGRGDDHRELIATCRRAGERHEIALLDIDVDAVQTQRSCSPRIDAGPRSPPRDQHRR